MRMTWLILVGAGLAGLAAGAAGAEPEQTAPDDDFAPGLGIMALVMIVVCLILIGVGIVVGLAFMAIAAALAAAGIVSASVVVGLLKKRPSAAARALFLQLGGLGGAAAGGVLALAVRWLAEMDVHWGWALAAGGLGGLAAGAAVALAFNFAWSRALDWLAARMKDPPRALGDVGGKSAGR